MDFEADLVLRPAPRSTAPVGGEDVNGTASSRPIQCGKEAAAHFALRPGFRNLNHGSFGTFPREVTAVQRALQDECEEAPDRFLRYTFPRKNDEARKAAAELVQADVDDIVFVPNTTTGINTVLRNLTYSPDDVILHLSTIYGACGKTVAYLVETTPVTAASITYTHPISDEDMCARFVALVAKVRAEGRNPRIAVFDAIVSLPGVRLPFERLVQLCREHGVLSCVDAAHSVGHIPLNLRAMDPDFFVTNCHKWLFTPRGSAIFYVPRRNQALMRTTLPTSHGFLPHSSTSDNIPNPLPPSSKSQFVNNFEFVGTLDPTPYLCLPTALAWRQRLVYKPRSGGPSLQGEEAVMRYCADLAQEGGATVAHVLGTEVLKGSDGTSFANVRLPVSGADVRVAQWMSQILVDEYETFMVIFVHGDRFWVRLSTQVYLTHEDFEWCAGALKEVCARAEKGEWK